jgi:hypothetical protein
MISSLSVLAALISVGCGIVTLVALVKFVAEIQQDIRTNNT